MPTPLKVPTTGQMWSLCKLPILLTGVLLKVKILLPQYVSVTHPLYHRAKKLQNVAICDIIKIDKLQQSNKYTLCANQLILCLNNINCNYNGVCFLMELISEYD